MIHISIGSNLGDRMENIRQAVRLLEQRGLMKAKCSIVVETAALLPEGAPASWNIPYLNAIASGETSLAPDEFLRVLKDIEHAVGRPASYKKWSPRVIDLDILLWDNKVIDTPTLAVPHGELLNRPFLVHLLALTDPLLRHPVTKEPFATAAARMPSQFICGFSLFPRLAGVVNVTPDSFSDGGMHLRPEAAIERIRALVRQGAAVVDLGAQSTRPGAALLSAEEEYARLAPVLDGAQDIPIPLSVDTFRPEVIRKILSRHPHVSWINDVTGALDDETLRAIAGSGKKIVMMHALSIPPRKDERLPDDTDPTVTLGAWSRATAARMEALGFKKQDIILDPGIGFGKSPWQNLHLLRARGAIREAGCSIMIGHSRKSYVAAFQPSEARERDLETIAISAYLVEGGVDYLRVHDIEGHQRFMTTHHLMSK